MNRAVLLRSHRPEIRRDLRVYGCGFAQRSGAGSAGPRRREAVLPVGAGAGHQELRRGEPGRRRELRPRLQGPAARRRAAAGLGRRGGALSSLCASSLLLTENET
jgi:hypothetical protein